MQDILESVRAIEGFLRQSPTLEQFTVDSLLQSAVLYQLIVIGEAVHHLPPALLARYPEVDWAAIDAMRNFIIHAYHRVDLHLAWEAATQEVPGLGKAVERVIAALK
jgi:uncharacterized protein with HEPN domain